MPAPISIPAPDHPVIRPCPSFPSLRRSYLHAGGGAERGADSAATPVAARGAGGPGGAHVGPENSHLVYVMDLWYVCGSLSAVAAASLHFSLAPSSVASGRFLSLSLFLSLFLVSSSLFEQHRVGLIHCVDGIPPDPHTPASQGLPGAHQSTHNMGITPQHARVWWRKKTREKKKKWRLYQIVWDAMPTATQDEMCGAQRARCHNSNDCYKNIVDLVFEEKSGKYFKCGGISIRGEAAGPQPVSEAYPKMRLTFSKDHDIFA